MENGKFNKRCSSTENFKIVLVEREVSCKSPVKTKVEELKREK